MIQVEKVNGLKMFVNPDLITHIESAPDTLITFLNGEKILLKTTAEDVVEKIIEFKRKIGREITTVKT